MKFKRNQKKAFTLVELLVVVGIIAVLTAVLLPGLVSARRFAELDEDVTNILLVIRRAQEQALYPNKAALGGNDTNILCRITFNKPNDPNKSFVIYGGFATNDCNGTVEGQLPTNTSLIPNLKYSTINTNLMSTEVPYEMRDDGVHFSVPFGGVLPKGAFYNNPSDEVQIIVQHKVDSNIRRTIKIFRSGIIDLQ